MGITNFESNILTLKMCIDNNGSGNVHLKTINTGSHKYYTTVIYENGNLNYFVDKSRSNGQHLGRVGIDRISIHGIEYNNRIIGSLPDSVVKEIMKFHKELMLRTGNYR